jgi:dienelactone hydrolase
VIGRSLGALAGCVLAVAGCGGGAATLSAQTPSVTSAVRTPRSTALTTSAAASRRASGSGRVAGLAPTRPGRAPFAVGERVVRFVDPTRLVRFPGRTPQPRSLVTLIRYPADGAAAGNDVRDAAPARRAGPFPLVIFGHGFAVTPGPYSRLLQAWARAGYIVAAPLFPLENATAPGGPNESDLVNQPRDMSVVITRLLQAGAERGSFWHGLIAANQIAVSGQSDGGETALAVAYDHRFLDRRVRAAVILSGAQIPGAGTFDFPAPSPPLLATQGTADTINPPSFTHAFFDIAPRPKYLLTMLGARHLAPYTAEQPQLRIVERVTTAFLDRYLKRARGAVREMSAAGDVPGVSMLRSDR